MILEIADWTFEVDMEATMAYSAQEAKEHCACAYCRNFYAAVDLTYPQLRPFLTQFGLDLEAPEELMPFDDGSYEAVYAVSGKVLKVGKDLEIGGICVYFDSPLEINTGCPAPCFLVDLGLFSLPWVLEETFEDVISPANEPGFLMRMLRKLLGRAEDTVKS